MSSKQTAKRLLIRADCTQLGLSVEASQDGGETWVMVQLTPYKTRSTSSVRQYSTCISPALDRAEYFAELESRGIDFQEVSSNA